MKMTVICSPSWYGFPELLQSNDTTTFFYLHGSNGHYATVNLNESRLSLLTTYCHICCSLKHHAGV